MEDGDDILWVYNPSSNNINCFTHKANSSESFSHPYINGIAADNEGTIWIGTYGGGLNKYDPIKQKFKHYYVSGYATNKDDPEEINVMGLDPSGGYGLPVTIGH